MSVGNGPAAVEREDGAGEADGIGVDQAQKSLRTSLGRERAVGERLFVDEKFENIGICQGAFGHWRGDEAGLEHIDANAICGIGGGGGADEGLKCGFGGRIADGIKMGDGRIGGQDGADQGEAAALAMHVRRLRLHLADTSLKGQKGGFKVQANGGLKAFQSAFGKWAVAGGAGGAADGVDEDIDGAAQFFQGGVKCNCKSGWRCDIGMNNIIKIRN